MADISQVKLPDGTTYNLKDSYVRTNYRALNNNDFDTINVTELNAGDLIVTGAARFLNTINGSISGNAVTATKATQDESGNNIKASYASSISISDHTITLKNKNGVSLGTVTVPDNATDNTKMPLAGGTFTGRVAYNNVVMPLSAGKVTNLAAGTTEIFKDGIAISNPATSNDVGWIRVIGTGESDTVMEIATGDDGGGTTAETIVVRQYNTSNAIAKEAILLAPDGTTSFPVSVTAPKFIGALQGNADSATLLNQDTTYKEGTAYICQTSAGTVKAFCSRANNSNIGLSTTGYGCMLLSATWGGGTSYNGELFMGMGDFPNLYFRGKNNNTYTAWKAIGQFTATPTSGQVVVTDGTTGGMKSSGYTIATSVPSGAVFTDHYDWADITNKPVTFITNSGALATNGWKTLGGRSSGNKIAISYASSSPATWNSEPYSASIVFGCSDTKGLVDCGYNNPIVTFGGASVNGSTDDAPKWYFRITGTSASTYNLNNITNGNARDNTKVAKAGDTMTGALNFANGTANKVGDDIQIGDCNASGGLGIQSLNGANTSIQFIAKSARWNATSERGIIEFDSALDCFSFKFI